ncbi:ethylbenzene dehydrogenase-related protein [Thiohalobacter sp. IOR34]|uniref:ethylbenzene dehydrogenase-related protein n=1 Tax=Thiohalobacter sp. IOR34 TaxID=3057176 RepID=UPI0025B0A1D7|nr:ethylbenzene dehydrogenase-related protein [Thiohalobacter sp. IOR34]WJW74908.1 ethylbenzene dehydrogenase-related protein [Thiohalobacter sp. IOR34]
MKTLITKIASYLVAAVLALPLAADARWGMGGGGGGGDGLTAVRVSGDVLVPPSDPVWNNATAVNVTLKFTDSVEGDTMGGGGSNSSLSVKAIHNGTDIAFLLTWNDATRDDVIEGPENFTDAGAVMLNANMICRMGQPSNPTNIWYWRAVDDSVQNLLSGGLGTITQTVNGDNISAISSWNGSQWQVVLSRPLAAIDPDDQIDLFPGGSYPIAFATWDGDNRERNGRKYRSGMNTLNIQN